MSKTTARTPRPLTGYITRASYLKMLSHNTAMTWLFTHSGAPRMLKVRVTPLPARRKRIGRTAK